MSVVQACFGALVALSLTSLFFSFVDLWRDQQKSSKKFRLGIRLLQYTLALIGLENTKTATVIAQFLVGIDISLETALSYLAATSNTLLPDYFRFKGGHLVLVICTIVRLTLSFTPLFLPRRYVFLAFALPLIIQHGVNLYLDYLTRKGAESKREWLLLNQFRTFALIGIEIPLIVVNRPSAPILQGATCSYILAVTCLAIPSPYTIRAIWGWKQGRPQDDAILLGAGSEPPYQSPQRPLTAHTQMSGSFTQADATQELQSARHRLPPSYTGETFPSGENTSSTSGPSVHTLTAIADPESEAYTIDRPNLPELEMYRVKSYRDDLESFLRGQGFSVEAIPLIVSFGSHLFDIAVSQKISATFLDLLEATDDKDTDKLYYVKRLTDDDPMVIERGLRVAEITTEFAYRYEIRHNSPRQLIPWLKYQIDSLSHNGERETEIGLGWRVE